MTYKSVSVDFREKIQDKNFEIIPAIMDKIMYR